MIKKISEVSIGIPAYNEEANIKNLLLSLIKQDTSTFILKEIIVVSDNSTDTTTEEVKSIKNRNLKLIENKSRLGQAISQNKIIEMFSGDILILLNADVLPTDNNFINKLIKPFSEDKNIVLVGPKIIPIKATTFFEKIINYSVDFKDSMAEKWRNGNNLYLCSGRGRAFRKDFAKKIKWETSLSEDAYTYLLCIARGHKFQYNLHAKLNFKSPDNFHDHMKQSARFVSGPNVMSKYFDKNLVTAEYVIPRKITFQTIIEYFIKNPILLSLYIATFLLIKINPNQSRHANTKWQISTSSKKLK